MNNLAATLQVWVTPPARPTCTRRPWMAIGGLLGDEHPGTLISMNNLAVTLEARRPRRGPPPVRAGSGRL